MNKTDASISTRREFIKALGPAAACTLLACRLDRTDSGQIADRPPNIVLIFVDDMGYGDLGCYGARGYETPSLDRMAKEGLRFTGFLASQGVCSASRASLLTGCYADRVGIQGALSPAATIGLHPDEETIADLLKARQYATAIFGKWHLGSYPEFLPLRQGFDEYLGLLYSNDMWPVGFDGKPVEGGQKSNYPVLPLFEGDRKIDEIRTLEDQGRLTTLYTERSIRFIERNRDRPFFLYLPHSMVHVPLGVDRQRRGKSRAGLYGDVVQEIDWSTGEIINTLRRLDLDNDTLVIFTSDNGPWLNFGNHAGSSGGFREGKGTAWEGGVRVPCLMRWPGRIAPGSECASLATTLDLLPTIVELADVPRPEKTIDGVSLVSILDGQVNATPRSNFYYYYNRELRAVREGRWKLFFPHKSRSYVGVEPGNDGFSGPYATLQVGNELYDLEADPGETRNVFDEHPDVVARLRALADEARAELGDALTQTRGKGQRAAGRAGSARPSVKNLASGAVIRLGSPPAARYAADGESSLVDGLRGSFDHADGRWLGFQGADFEARLELREPLDIQSVGVGFLSSQPAWIFLPAAVEIAVSMDDAAFKTVRTFSERLVEDPLPRAQEYRAELGGRRVRFVRVRAKTIGACPEWHAGAGGKSWLFVDEILVQ